MFLCFGVFVVQLRFFPEVPVDVPHSQPGEHFVQRDCDLLRLHAHPHSVQQSTDDVDRVVLSVYQQDHDLVHQETSCTSFEEERHPNQVHLSNHDNEEACVSGDIEIRIFPVWNHQTGKSWPFPVSECDELEGEKILDYRPREVKHRKRVDNTDSFGLVHSSVSMFLHIVHRCYESGIYHERRQHLQSPSHRGM